MQPLQWMSIALGFMVLMFFNSGLYEYFDPLHAHCSGRAYKQPSATPPSSSPGIFSFLWSQPAPVNTSASTTDNNNATMVRTDSSETAPTAASTTSRVTFSTSSNHQLSDGPHPRSSSAAGRPAFYWSGIQLVDHLVCLRVHFFIDSAQTPFSKLIAAVIMNLTSAVYIFMGIEGTRWSASWLKRLSTNSLRYFLVCLFPSLGANQPTFSTLSSFRQFQLKPPNQQRTLFTKAATLVTIRQQQLREAQRRRRGVFMNSPLISFLRITLHPSLHFWAWSIFDHPAYRGPTFSAQTRITAYSRLVESWPTSGSSCSSDSCSDNNGDDDDDDDDIDENDNDGDDHQEQKTTTAKIFRGGSKAARLETCNFAEVVMQRDGDSRSWSSTLICLSPLWLLLCNTLGIGGVFPMIWIPLLIASRNPPPVTGILGSSPKQEWKILGKPASKVPAVHWKTVYAIALAHFLIVGGLVVHSISSTSDVIFKDWWTAVVKNFELKESNDMSVLDGFWLVMVVVPLKGLKSFLQGVFHWMSIQQASITLSISSPFIRTSTGFVSPLESIWLYMPNIMTFFAITKDFLIQKASLPVLSTELLIPLNLVPFPTSSLWIQTSEPLNSYSRNNTNNDLRDIAFICAITLVIPSFLWILAQLIRSTTKSIIDSSRGIFAQAFQLQEPLGVSIKSRKRLSMFFGYYGMICFIHHVWSVLLFVFGTIAEQQQQNESTGFGFWSQFHSSVWIPLIHIFDPQYRIQHIGLTPILFLSIDTISTMTAVIFWMISEVKADHQLENNRIPDIWRTKDQDWYRFLIFSPLISPGASLMWYLKKREHKWMMMDRQLFKESFAQPGAVLLTRTSKRRKGDDDDIFLKSEQGGYIIQSGQLDEQ